MDTMSTQDDLYTKGDEGNVQGVDTAGAYWKKCLNLRPAWISSTFPSTGLVERNAQADALAMEAHALHRLMSEVNARRNALSSPILVLPSEILTMVFRLLADDTGDDNGDESDFYWPLLPEDDGEGPPFDRYYTERLGWVLITHVCQTWRNIALNDAGLWSRVKVSDGFPWKEFTHRVRGATITVDVRDPQSALSNDGILHHHLESVKNLTMEINSRDQMTALISRLSEPAPELLEMNLRSSRSYFDEHSFPHGITFPHDFFSTCAPALRHLHLQDLWRNFPWDTAARNIRTLALSDVYCSTTLSEIFSILKHLEMLETFSFRNCIPRLNIVDVFPLRNTRLHLPHLRHLILNAPGEMVVALWESIVAPADLKIDFVCETCDDATIFTLERLLKNYIQCTERPAHPSLRLRNGYHMLSLEIDTRDTALGHRARNVYRDTASHLRIDFSTLGLSDVSESFKSLVKVALSILPRIIRCAHDLTTWSKGTNIHELFQPTTSNVHTLEFDHCPSSVRLFMEALDQPIGTQSTNILFPALRTIIISNLDITDELNLDYIYRALVSRKELGYKLFSLDIRHMGPSLNDRAGRILEHWEELVDRVYIRLH